MKYNHRIISLCFLLAAVLLLAIHLRRNESYAQNQVYDSEFETFSNVNAQNSQSYFIDQTDDVKSLGYTGQRKIVALDEKIFFVVYRKKFDGKYQIFFKKLNLNDDLNMTNGGSPVAIVGNGGNQRVPSIAISDDKKIHVVWYGADKEENSRQVKYANSSDNGEIWSDWKNVAEVDGYSGQEFWQEHPVIVTSGKRIFVAWEGRDEKNQDKQQIKFVKSDDEGKNWAEWKNIRESSEFTQSRPTLVMRQDRLFVFMYSSQNTNKNRQQIKYSYSDNFGETWSEWKTFSDPNFDSRHVAVVNDKQNVLHVVWRQQDISGASQIMYRRFYGDSINDPIVVSRSSENQFFPSIGMDGDGTIWLSWIQTENQSAFPNEDPRDGKIYVARLDDEEFIFNREIKGRAAGLYPNFPQSTHGLAMPLLYESKMSEDLFEIVLENVK